MNTYSILQKIFPLTQKFLQLAPWEWMDEVDIFGIRSPESGTVYFISVMGSAGIQPSIAAYEGSMALGEFWEIQNPDSYTPPERMLIIPHMVINFITPDETSEEQLERIKQSEFDFGNNTLLPDILRIIPGRFPTLPSQEYLQDLVFILEQTLEVCARVKDNPSMLEPDDDELDRYFIREAKESGNKLVWQDKSEIIEPETRQFPILLSPDTVEEYLNLSKKPGVLQLDVTTLQAPVKDGDNDPFFPFVLMLVDKKSGDIVSFRLLQPMPGVETMYGSVPSEMIEMMTEAGFRPFAIELRCEILIDLLQKVKPQLDLNLNITSNMVEMDDAIAGMKENLMNMG